MKPTAVIVTKDNNKFDGVTNPVVQISHTSGGVFTASVGNIPTPVLPTPLLAAAGGVEAAPSDTTSPSDARRIRHHAARGHDTAAGDRRRFRRERSAADKLPAAHPVIVDDGVLSQAELDYFVDAAIARWSAAGLTHAQLDALEAMSLRRRRPVGPQSRLVHAGADHARCRRRRPRLVPRRARPATTPSSAPCFAATRMQTDPTGAPAGHYDLLTAVMHEMGHTLGLGDSLSRGRRATR